MTRLACVNCHGPQGRGGTIRTMMYSFEVPNITWPALTSPGGDHPAFTEDTLRKAITTGIEPDGQRLEAPMPVWQMSDNDLSDLVKFIRTLK
jgi:cytochrome c oxidase subunit II